MKLKFLGAALLAAAIGTTAQAAPVTVNVSASAPFTSTDGFDPVTFDPIPLITDTNGSVSGSFVFDDTLGGVAGVVESGEILSFSVTSSGFGAAERNFTASSAAGGFATVDNSPGTVAIGGGFSIGNVFFFDGGGSDSFEFFNFDAGVGVVATVFPALDPNFTALQTADFTIAADIDVVPLPAPIAMMAGGLLAFGFVARRQSKNRRDA